MILAFFGSDGNLGRADDEYMTITKPPPQGACALAVNGGLFFFCEGGVASPLNVLSDSLRLRPLLACPPTPDPALALCNSAASRPGEM